jgi:hypothetical protein
MQVREHYNVIQISFATIFHQEQLTLSLTMKLAGVHTYTILDIIIEATKRLQGV